MTSANSRIPAGPDAGGPPRITSPVPDLIQIVRSLPPVIDGIGAYAFELAGALLSSGEARTTFVVTDPAWNRDQTGGFETHRLAGRSNNALSDLLARLSRCSGSVVLLHYCGYGYAANGAPEWLAKALEEYVAAGGSFACNFHELFAPRTWPWTRTFWYSAKQENVAREIAAMASAMLTNGAARARTLNNWRSNDRCRVQSLPVFSNVGEPDIVKPLSDRKRRIVVFGSRMTRKLAYGRSLATLKKVIRRLDIDEVIDIGPHVSLPANFPVTATGPLAASEISDLLQDSVAGFINYGLHVLAKSTVFAAYSAHGVVPVVDSPAGFRPDDDLRPEWEYMPAAAPAIGSRDVLDRVSASARSWYQQHNLAQHCRTVAGIARELAGGPGAYARTS